MSNKFQRAVNEVLKKFDQDEYIKQYNKENYKHFHIKVRLDEEDVLNKLDEVDNKNGYIINLIKKDIKGGK